jgi:hypothetical protein
MSPYFYNIKIHHTKPIMPRISGILHASIKLAGDEKTRENAEKLFMFNNSIFTKAEFAKSAYRTIKFCYENYAVPIAEGYGIRPELMVPAMKEVDSLIFELGTILDFLAREVNIAYGLGISRKDVGFKQVVTRCKSVIPEDEITSLLCEFSSSDLHQYFRQMRNRITHRLPFLLKGMDDQFFLPDDPESDTVEPRTDLKIDLLETCEKWLFEILEFVDQASFIIYKDISEYQLMDGKGNPVSEDEWVETSRKEILTKLRTYQKSRKQ